MLRKSLAVLFAASLSAVAGCASTGESLWARSTSLLPGRSGGQEHADGAGSSSKADEDELSPEFKAAQKTFRNTEQTMLVWARYQEDAGEYAEARKKYRELLVAYPDCVEASIGLARIERATGRNIQAEEILREVASRHPDHIGARLEIGRHYSKLDRWPEAISAFEQAVELDASNQESRYELGVALARTGQFDPALAHLTYSVGESAAHYNLGYILYEKGQHAESAEWFRNALASHPDEQTREKSRQMLAQVAPKAGEQLTARNAPNRFVSSPVEVFPASSASSRNASVAKQESQPQNGQPLTAPVAPRQSATLNPASRDQMMVSASIPATSRVQRAEEPVVLPPVSQGMPVSGVSWSAPADTRSGGPVTTQTTEPPHWQGRGATGTAASMQQPAPLYDTPPAQSSGPVEPPLWRARK